MPLEAKLKLMKSSLVFRLFQNDYTKTFLNDLKISYENTEPKRSILNQMVHGKKEIDEDKTLSKHKLRVKNILNEHKNNI